MSAQSFTNLYPIVTVRANLALSTDKVTFLPMLTIAAENSLANHSLGA